MRPFVWVLIVVAFLAAALAVLDKTWLLVPIGPFGASDAPTIPACNGRVLTEGFTYKFRDPQRGDLVGVRTRGELGQALTPDPNGNLTIAKRIVGVPGDTVTVKRGYVRVNGVQFDDLVTKPFPAVTLAPDEYFVLDDNRSFGQDSRDFGPVPRDAIFGRVLLVYWPLGHFGSPASRNAGPSPGPISC